MVVLDEGKHSQGSIRLNLEWTHGEPAIASAIANHWPDLRHCQRSHFRQSAPFWLSLVSRASGTSSSLPPTTAYCFSKAQRPAHGVVVVGESTSAFQLPSDCLPQTTTYLALTVCGLPFLSLRVISYPPVS